MDVVDEFLERYVRERDYYADAAANAWDLLEARLFATVDEVRASVVDLAGARVALYFPGDRRRVNALIVDVFKSVETREFPRPSEPASGTPVWKKRFSGYGATHHRVHLVKERLPEVEQCARRARAPGAAIWSCAPDAVGSRNSKEFLAWRHRAA